MQDLLTNSLDIVKTSVEIGFKTHSRDHQVQIKKIFIKENISKIILSCEGYISGTSFLNLIADYTLVLFKCNVWLF